MRVLGVGAGGTGRHGVAGGGGGNKEGGSGGVKTWGCIGENGKHIINDKVS